MAEQLGRGLQNLVDRCDSGSRLTNLLESYAVAAARSVYPARRCSLGFLAGYNASSRWLNYVSNDR